MFLENIIALIMESRDEVKTNWMGDYFALIGNCLLHSDNGDTCCKLARYFIFMVSFGQFPENGQRQMAYIIYLIELWGNTYKKVYVF